MRRAGIAAEMTRETDLPFPLRAPYASTSRLSFTR